MLFFPTQHQRKKANSKAKVDLHQIKHVYNASGLSTLTPTMKDRPTPRKKVKSRTILAASETRSQAADPLKPRRSKEKKLGAFQKSSKEEKMLLPFYFPTDSLTLNNSISIATSAQKVSRDLRKQQEEEEAQRTIGRSLSPRPISSRRHRELVEHQRNPYQYMKVRNTQMHEQQMKVEGKYHNHTGECPFCKEEEHRIEQILAGKRFKKKPDKIIIGDPTITAGKGEESISTFKDMYGIFSSKNKPLPQPKIPLKGLAIKGKESQTILESQREKRQVQKTNSGMSFKDSMSPQGAYQQHPQKQPPAEPQRRSTKRLPLNSIEDESSNGDREIMSTRRLRKARGGYRVLLPTKYKEKINRSLEQAPSISDSQNPIISVNSTKQSPTDRRQLLSIRNYSSREDMGSSSSGRIRTIILNKLSPQNQPKPPPPKGVFFDGRHHERPSRAYPREKGLRKSITMKIAPGFRASSQSSPAKLKKSPTRVRQSGVLTKKERQSQDWKDLKYETNLADIEMLEPEQTKEEDCEDEETPVAPPNITEAMNEIEEATNQIEDTQLNTICNSQVPQTDKITTDPLPDVLPEHVNQTISLGENVRRKKGGGDPKISSLSFSNLNGDTKHRSRENMSNIISENKNTKCDRRSQDQLSVAQQRQRPVTAGVQRKKKPQPSFMGSQQPTMPMSTLQKRPDSSAFSGPRPKSKKKNWGSQRETQEQMIKIIGSFKQPKYFKIAPFIDPTKQVMTPEEKVVEEREKSLSAIKFVVVSKNQFDDYRKMKLHKQQTKSIIMSDNLKGTKASTYLNQIHRSKSLLGKKILRPQASNTFNPLQEVESTLSGPLEEKTHPQTATHSHQHSRLHNITKDKRTEKLLSQQLPSPSIIPPSEQRPESWSKVAKDRFVQYSIKQLYTSTSGDVEFTKDPEDDVEEMLKPVPVQPQPNKPIARKLDRRIQRRIQQADSLVQQMNNMTEMKLYSEMHPTNGNISNNWKNYSKEREDTLMKIRHKKLIEARSSGGGRYSRPLQSSLYEERANALLSAEAAEEGEPIPKRVPRRNRIGLLSADLQIVEDED